MDRTAHIILPKYVSREPDRHGNIRYYFRRGARRTRLVSEPGTQDFFNEIAAVATRNEISHAPPGELVYFILYGRRVKIGTSRDLDQRHANIRTSLPGKSTILYVTPGGSHLERELHRKFATYRVNREWFIYSHEIRDWIENDKERRLEKHAV
jgi:Meiotically up-regulated gene 113